MVSCYRCFYVAPYMHIFYLDMCCIAPHSCMVVESPPPSVAFDDACAAACVSSGVAPVASVVARACNAR